MEARNSDNPSDHGSEKRAKLSSLSPNSSGCDSDDDDAFSKSSGRQSAVKKTEENLVQTSKPVKKTSEVKSKGKLLDSNEGIKKSKVESKHKSSKHTSIEADSQGDAHSRDGVNMLAPNGVPLSELISLNETIEGLQQQEDQHMLDAVVSIIADTDHFDLDDTAVFFDICSIEKHVIMQIQQLLKA